MKKSLQLTGITFGIALVVSLLTAGLYVLLDEQKDALGLSVVALSIVALLVLPFLVYPLLRRLGFASRSEVTTTLVVSIGLTISSIIENLILMPWLANHTNPIGLVLGAAVFGFVILFVVSLTMTSVAKWLYQRKHSIIT